MFRYVLKATLFLTVILLWLLTNTSASQALIVFVDHAVFEGSDNVLFGLIVISCLIYLLLMALLLVDVALPVETTKRDELTHTVAAKTPQPVHHHPCSSGLVSNLEKQTSIQP